LFNFGLYFFAQNLNKTRRNTLIFEKSAKTYLGAYFSLTAEFFQPRVGNTGIGAGFNGSRPSYGRGVAARTGPHIPIKYIIKKTFQHSDLSPILL
jgi:hypothetical protein